VTSLGRVLAVGALAAYALASHWLMLNAAAESWAVAALCGPLLLLVLGIAWKRRDALSIAGSLLLLVVLTLVAAHGGTKDANRLYVLQHAGIHLALAWIFGSTLRAGGTPFITALAERVHRSVTPAMRAYTRRLTAVWTAYFVAMALLSCALYAAAPWSWWSLFGNVLTPLSLLLMFGGEHWLRYRLHPEFERASIVQAVQAYRRSPAGR
jgi:uncharacterized membrane protein